ncbi:MAG TPA: alpha/beta hydrolase [Longimicrobium sp.]|nr:alpha/beta hydrolase [Longimicrobium sp.]
MTSPPPETDGDFLAPDGLRLAYRAWTPAAPRAALLVVHGLGEHGGRYAALARALSARGVAVFALDLRGHGRSGGARAYTPRFEQLVEDVEAFRRHVALKLPAPVPVFLLGHSLGGLVSIRWLQTHPEAPLAGAVLSSPLLGVAVKAPRWKVAMAGVLTRVLPKLPLSNEIDPAELSSDPAYVRSYREDPLVHTRITPRLYTELMAHIGHAFAERGRFGHPLLFLVSGADTVVQAGATHRFAEGLTGDVTVHRYDGFRHESLNEAGRARPIADLTAWLEARIGTASA